MLVGSMVGLYKDGISSYSIGDILLFGSASLLFIFEKRWDQFTTQLIQKKRDSFKCQITKDHFYFPKGYYFKHASIGKSKQLPFWKVNEIRINTIPPSAQINDNELIFLSGLSEKDLQPLKSKIPFSSPQDNWYLICDEFLDTEYSTDQQQMAMKRLAENNILEDEVLAIRKKIAFRMLIRTYVTWEWLYYGQWDVLKELWPINAKKYWWTMDVDLRK